MVKVEICGSNDDALEQVIEPSNTQRLVRKPHMQPCFLSVESDEPAAVIVEVDGEEVADAQLGPGRHSLPILTMLVPQRSKLLSLMPARTRHQATPSAFTLSVRQGNRDGRLLGTYNYRLVCEREFDEIYGRRSADSSVLPGSAQFTNDERSLDTARNCWHCQAPLNGNTCARCGQEQEEQQ